MKPLCLRGFFLKATERVYVLLKNSTMDFQNNSPFKRAASFYVTITGSFERFWTNFEEDDNLFQKPDVTFFKCNVFIQNCHFRSQR